MRSIALATQTVVERGRDRARILHHEGDQLPQHGAKAIVDASSSLMIDAAAYASMRANASSVRRSIDAAASPEYLMSGTRFSRD